jgi:hypothetical protein
MWETLDTCYERPDKYAEEALKPIVDFRRYKIVDSAAVREFYSLVRAAIKGARRIGRVELLINDQDHEQDAPRRLEGVGHQEARQDEAGRDRGFRGLH